MVRASKKSGRGRYYARYLSHYTKRNTMLIWLGFLFLAGVFAGSALLFTAEDDVVNLLTKLVGSFVERRKTQSVSGIFLSSAMSSMGFAAFLFLCGFSAVGHPFEMLTPFFRGLGFGFSTSSLYRVYGSEAIAYVGVLIFPGMLISTVILLFCCRESLRLSRSVLRGMRGTAEGEPHSLRLYMARYIAACAAIGFSALVEAFLYSALANTLFLG